MLGDPEMNDLPSPVPDHEPRIRKSESNGGPDEEVHRGDTMLVIAKECLPALALIMVRLSFWEISRDCGVADRDPKLREFSPDLSGSPAVLVRESPNEDLHLSRNRRPSGSTF